MGLLSHQILIQTIGCLLLNNCSNMVAVERDVINSSLPADDGDEGGVEDSSDLGVDMQLPGKNMLSPSPSLFFSIFLQLVETNVDLLTYTVKYNTGLYLFVSAVSAVCLPCILYEKSRAAVDPCVYMSQV